MAIWWKRIFMWLIKSDSVLVQTFHQFKIKFEP
jgi:hypothetical protein